MNAADIIAKKRDGGELSAEEIRYIIAGVTSELVPDYQAAAWLMAVFLRGMNRRETLDLTLAMRDSGQVIDLSDLANGPALDKHSTGGVGDKTSLVVVPILAAAGVPILKMSGRGLGYSGGTIDKLEAIPGLRTDLSIDEAKRIVNRVGAVMIAQSSQLAPADKILYALRDVTATVESIPLIAASIMSKKLASGGQRILLDVKCGAGAFMKTRDKAEHLAQELVAIGNGAGVPTVAMLTAMDEPLGCAVGNALEVREAIETLRPNPDSFETTGSDLLQNSPTVDDFFTSSSLLLNAPRPFPLPGRELFHDLCTQLAAHGLVAVGKARDFSEGRAMASNLVAHGAALKKLVEIVSAQGGPDSADKILDLLPLAARTRGVAIEVGGYVAAIDAETIGRLATEMGAGRQKKGDRIDYASGIVLHCKTGAPLLPGRPLATLYLRDEDAPRTDEFAARLRSAYRITDKEPQVKESLVLGVIR